MLTIDVRAAARGAARQFFELPQKQVTFATAVALTRTAQDVKAAEQAELSRVFDRPTRYTLNSLYLKPAKRSDLVAKVWFKDEAGKGGTPATKFLLPNVEGGDRSLKRFERALQAAGVLPRGMAVVPGSAVTLDAYGNIPRQLITQILAYFSAFGEQGYRANMTTERREKLARGSKRKGTSGFRLFVLRSPRGRLPPGIYRRSTAPGSREIQPLLVFVDGEPNYEKRFQFYEVANRTARRVFNDHMSTALRQALATARPE